MEPTGLTVPPSGDRGHAGRDRRRLRAIPETGIGSRLQEDGRGPHAGSSAPARFPFVGKRPRSPASSAWPAGRPTDPTCAHAAGEGSLVFRSLTKSIPCRSNQCDATRERSGLRNHPSLQRIAQVPKCSVSVCYSNTRTRMRTNPRMHSVSLCHCAEVCLCNCECSDQCSAVTCAFMQCITTKSPLPRMSPIIVCVCASVSRASRKYVPTCTKIRFEPIKLSSEWPVPAACAHIARMCVARTQSLRSQAATEIDSIGIGVAVRVRRCAKYSQRMALERLVLNHLKHSEASCRNCTRHAN